MLTSHPSRHDQERIGDALGMKKEYCINCLHCMANLRNIYSHGGRLYNRAISPPIKLSTAFYRTFKNQKNDSLAAYIIALFRLLQEKSERTLLLENITKIHEEFGSEIDPSMYGFSDDYIDTLQKLFLV